MKFWPATDPRSSFYPNDMRTLNESQAKKRKIQTARARGLHRIADQLAQEKLPLRIEPKDRQLTLFADYPETMGWKPGGDGGID